MYIATISTLGFAASINETCGREIKLSRDTVWIELSDATHLFKLRRGVCNIYTGSN